VSLWLLPQGGQRPRDLDLPSGGALAALIVVMLFGQAHDVLAPYEAGAATGQALLPPGLLHPLGTDILGRDLLSEAVHGLGTTVSAALIGVAVLLVAGHFAGLLAAHRFGRGGFIFRIGANVLASLPALLLAILFSALLVQGGAAFAVGLALAPHAFLRSFDRARVILAAPYSDYARASGVSAVELLKRELRHALREIIPVAARALASVTMIYATMSFFGFGAKPPLRDLGLMIASARADLAIAWWTAAVPAVTLILFILIARLAAGPEGERP
jgi:peptide/nickel transport system permease protein